MWKGKLSAFSCSMTRKVKLYVQRHSQLPPLPLKEKQGEGNASWRRNIARPTGMEMPRHRNIMRQREFSMLTRGRLCVTAAWLSWNWWALLLAQGKPAALPCDLGATSPMLKPNLPQPHCCGGVCSEPLTSRALENSLCQSISLEVAHLFKDYLDQHHHFQEVYFFSWITANV